MGGIFGGGGSHSTTTTTSQPQLPGQVSALMDTVLPNVQQAFTNQPLTDFQKPMPTALADLTPDQQRIISGVVGRADLPALNTPESQALSGYLSAFSPNAAQGAAGQAFASEAAGPIGSSPATVEGMKALETQFTDVTKPTIENEMAAAGLGRSGALGDSLARARSGVAAATVPLLQSDEMNRLAAAQGLSGLGSSEMQQLLAGSAGAGTLGQVAESQTTGRNQQAFDAAEVIRQMVQSRNQEAQQDFLRRQALTEGISGTVTGFAPATFASAGTTKQKISGGK